MMKENLENLSKENCFRYTGKSAGVAGRDPDKILYEGKESQSGWSQLLINELMGLKAVEHDQDRQPLISILVNRFMNSSIKNG